MADDDNIVEVGKHFAWRDAQLRCSVRELSLEAVQRAPDPVREQGRGKGVPLLNPLVGEDVMGGTRAVPVSVGASAAVEEKSEPGEAWLEGDQFRQARAAYVAEV